MAEKPAAEIENMDKVKLAELEPGSPEYEHKKKLIREEKLRKKNSVVLRQWTEYHHRDHDKGGKCLLKKQMKNGNVHSFYLGRLKKGGKGALEAFFKKGVKMTIGAEHFKYLQKKAEPAEK